MKHKHAELIKAWADGAVIEHRCLTRPDFSHWHEFDEYWEDYGEWEYRIKPEPKPDVEVLWQKPPVKELTDEEIEEVWYEECSQSDSLIEFARAILRKAQEND